MVINTNTIALGIIIVFVFIWRFARTRQLYLTSLHVQASGSEPIPFKPHDLRSFVQQALLGRRSMKPTSFSLGHLFLWLSQSAFSHSRTMSLSSTGLSPS